MSKQNNKLRAMLNRIALFLLCFPNRTIEAFQHTQDTSFARLPNFGWCGMEYLLNLQVAVVLAQDLGVPLLVLTLN